MNSNVFKDRVIDSLGRADSCADARQVIELALTGGETEQPGISHQTGLIHSLHNELLLLAAADFDYNHWCNIRCAILYLEKMKTGER